MRARSEHYDGDYVSTDPRFVHAHVTALGPFLQPADLTPGALARVAEIASATAAFDFTLAEMAVFPNGIIHLLPEPRAPFEVLTGTAVGGLPGVSAVCRGVRLPSCHT